MVFNHGFQSTDLVRRCALEPSFFFNKRQYTEQSVDRQGEQFTEDSISQKQFMLGEYEDADGKTYIVDIHGQCHLLKG